MSRPITVSMSPANVNLAGIAALQTTGGAGNLTLAATTVTLTNASFVALTSTGNISGVTFTVTGTDPDGNAITDTITGPNNNTVYGVKAFLTVTQIAVNGAVATNTRAGWDGTGSVEISPTSALNFFNPIATEISLEVTGTVNATVQECFDDVLLTVPTNAVWYDVTALASKTANTRSQISVCATAVRLKVNTYSNGATAKMVIIQPRLCL